MLNYASQRLNSSLHSAARRTTFNALVKAVSGSQYMHKSCSSDTGPSHHVTVTSVTLGLSLKHGMDMTMRA